MGVSSLEELIGELGYFGVDGNSLRRRIGDLNQVSREMGIMGVNISPISSKDQMIQVAQSYGLPSGSIMDFVGTTHEGSQWDFGREEHRRAAREMVCSASPLIVIGTDVRIEAGQMNKYQWARVVEHMEFLSELYEHQMGKNRY